MEEVRRYVNIAYIFVAIIAAWFFMKIVALVFAVANAPDAPIWDDLLGSSVTYSTIIGIILGAVLAIALTRSPKVYEGSLNVAREMKKVTWPTADETKYAMIVVIVMSLIVAGILFAFDFVAKQLTELILGIN